MKLSVIVLGAGLGSRMKSSKPKAMQKLGGYTMMEHLIFITRLTILVIIQLRLNLAVKIYQTAM